MSAVVKTPTPFVEQELLMEALCEINAQPILIASTTELANHKQRSQLNIGDIITNRVDYYGAQHFRYENGVFVLKHDSSEMITSNNKSQYTKVSTFLSQVDQAYRRAWDNRQARLAEQERQRIELERQTRVEAARQQAIQKAKQQGYNVQEKRIGQKIQLVLTRTTY